MLSVESPAPKANTSRRTQRVVNHVTTSDLCFLTYKSPSRGGILVARVTTRGSRHTRMPPLHGPSAEVRRSREPTSHFCLLPSAFKRNQPFAKWRHPRSPGDGQGSRHARMPPLRERSPKKAHVRTTEELAAGWRARVRLDRQEDAPPGHARHVQQRERHERDDDQQQR